MTSETAFRVLHIGSGRYPPGDQDHVTYGIWKALASGFQQYHVIGRSSARRADWTDKNLRITLIRSWIQRELEFLVSQFSCVAMMIRDRPDIIVCQSPAAGGLAALVAAKVTGAHLLVELHSDIYFPPFRSRSKAWLYHLISKPTLRRADRIRVLSGHMKERLGLGYGEQIAGKARVLAPRVDLALFTPKLSKFSLSDPLRLIMVGSIIPRKGQLRLIDALAGISFPIELHLVGDGADLAQCRARANDVENLRIVCHGAVVASALPPLLRMADLFVLFSNSEGTPRAIIEAMAAGLPVITTNAGFCADLVQNEVEGFVLGTDPDREIVEVLGRFRADPALGQRLGAAARARAERDYDSIRLFADYRRLIAEAAGAR
jgi:glycosyltransferase involved in cell wall biosynthesis